LKVAGLASRRHHQMVVVPNNPFNADALAGAV